MMLRHAAHLGQAHGRAGGCEHKDTLPQQVVRDAVHKLARRHRVEELRLKTGGVNTSSVTGAVRHAVCCKQRGKIVCLAKGPGAPGHMCYKTLWNAPTLQLATRSLRPLCQTSAPASNAVGRHWE